MFYSLDDAIREIFGADARIADKTRVFGGDANDSFRLTLKDGTGLFMKTNTGPMLSSFQAEAEGLSAIAQTGKIGTPKVLAIGTDPGGFSFLLQELLVSGQKIRDYWETLGAELAAMHRAPIPRKTGRGLALPRIILSERESRSTPGTHPGSIFSGTAGSYLSFALQKSIWTKKTGPGPFLFWIIWTDT